MRSHRQAVHDQFDPRAEAYLTSPVHADGPDLAAAAALVAGTLGPSARALDVGCGAGHLSFRLAPLLGSIVAVDPSPAMLSTVASAAAARGLAQVHTRQSSAEQIPFAAASFDLVASRYSAHHWTHLQLALSELQRVTRPDGWLLLIDSLAPEDALVDTHLQSIELLRDPSHVRNRSVSEWRALLRAAGFEVGEQRQWPTPIEFGSWVARMGTAPEHVAAIRSLQTQAPSEVQQALGLGSDGSFVLQTGLFWARRAATG